MSDYRPRESSAPPLLRPNSGRVSTVTGGAQLYSGSQGAGNWQRVIDEPGYPLHFSDLFGMKSMRGGAIAPYAFSTVVSYGPGEGTAELELLRGVVTGTAAPPIWLPIDISAGLLGQSVHRVAAEFPVPAQYCADFESDGPWLGSQLSQHRVGPTLFTMLGGTFANFRESERDFLDSLRAVMTPSDAFLVDVPTAEAGWSTSIEPRLHAANYSPAFRRFLGADEETDSFSNPQVPFEERFVFEHRHQPDPSAELIQVLSRSTGELVLGFRRYRLGDLSGFFQRQGFRLLHVQSSTRVLNQAFSMAVALISLPGTTGRSAP